MSLTSVAAVITPGAAAGTNAVAAEFSAAGGGSPTAASGLATWLCSKDILVLAVESNSFATMKDCYVYAVVLFIRMDQVRFPAADLRDARLDYLVALRQACSDGIRVVADGSQQQQAQAKLVVNQVWQIVHRSHNSVL